MGNNEVRIPDEMDVAVSEYQRNPMLHEAVHYHIENLEDVELGRFTVFGFLYVYRGQTLEVNPEHYQD